MVYPLITLYSAGETKFETNGLGSLGEATSCKVTEEANGQFELEMNYPVHGRRFKDLELRRIIYTKPNPVDPPQGFRIYEITKPMNGIVTVYAAHLRYDLSGYPLSSFEVTNCGEALSGLVSHSIIEHPFTFWTDKDTQGEFSVVTPISVTEALGGSEGSILDVYGGEYKFDNFTVRLYNHRGMDRGVSIRYGKNMTDFKQEENSSTVYTHVYPYWETEDSLVAVSEPIKLEGDYDFVNVLILNLSSEFEDPPYESDLIEVAQEYIKNNDFGKPEVSLTVSFAQLEQTEEYRDISLLERVELFDTVSVEFPEMRVSKKATVNKTVYNPLTARYESVTLGTIRATLSDTIIDQSTYVDEAIDETKTFLERSTERATNWITNGKGYMVAVRDEAGNWKEICSLDTPDINTAINVWRWNNGGFGFSSNGYNGPYKLAMTQDGHINADFIDVGSLTANIIKTGILNAALIRAGILSSVDGETFYLDLENGILRMKATELSITGKTVQEIVEEQTTDSIGDFITQTYDPKIAELQKQIDGQIENYFYDYDPTLDNEPASEWTTEDEYRKHEGDIFYNRAKGYAYRFFKDGDTWKWQLIQDTDITKALDAAAAAQDTADGKRRVFTTTPKPPYDIGDLWVQGEHGDILRCNNPKSTGANYAESDWELASKYTDDSGLTAFIDGEYKDDLDAIRQQADQKAETWYQSTNPANSWTSAERAEHKGDLWYNTSDSKIYIYSGSAWEESTSEVPQDVFDKIDGKAQIFTSTPTVPYHKGDLWFGGTSSDIKVCTTTRTSGSYSSNDWQKRDRYIDSTTATTAATNAANTAITNKMTQQNIFNALTNNGVDEGFFLQNGHVYINGSYIQSGTIAAQYIDVANLVAQRLKSVSNSYYTEIQGARIYGGYGSTQYGMLDLTSWTTAPGISGRFIVLKSNDGACVYAQNNILLYVPKGGAIQLQRGTYRGHILMSPDPTASSYGTIDYFYTSNSGKKLAFYDMNGSVYFVDVTASDARKKRNILETNIRALDVINAIGHCSFDFIDDGEHRNCGYIAQQLQEVNPEFVSSAPNKDENGNDTDKYTLFVDSFAILGYATKAIQELSEENDILKARCDNLEERLAKLESLVEALVN